MFRLAHLSDPHLPSPGGLGPIGDLISKRTLSRLAWRRKRLQHDPSVLAVLTADIAAYAPDHLAVTGDLTNFSTSAEYAGARAWLETLGAPADVTLSPGNHDALVVQGQADRFATLKPWFGDADSSEFPQARRRGGVALVNLCSAIPTPPLFAGGRLGEAQLERLAGMLGALGAQGLYRVVTLHHPPAEGVVSRRKALIDAKALRAVLLAHGAELVLHGHGHEAAFSAVPGPFGPIPVLGVPSASANGRGHHPAARWHAIEIDPAAGCARVVARGFDRKTGRMAEIGRYLLPGPKADAA